MKKYIAIVKDDRSNKKIMENKVLVLEQAGDKIFSGVKPGEIVRWANLTLSLYGIVDEEEAILENQMGFFVDDIQLVYRRNGSKWQLWTGDDHWNKFVVDDIIDYAFMKLKCPYDNFGEFHINRPRGLMYINGKLSYR